MGAIATCPLTGLKISGIIRRYVKKAGLKIPLWGAHTLRQSWVIRALAHDSPMKAIAQSWSFADCLLETITVVFEDGAFIGCHTTSNVRRTSRASACGSKGLEINGTFFSIISRCTRASVV